MSDIRPEWEIDYWETILDEAEKEGDEVKRQIALEHLAKEIEPIYPNIEDTSLLE